MIMRQRSVSVMLLVGALIQSMPGAGQEPAPGGQQTAPRTAAFGQCAVCHSTDGSNGTGPTLKGVFGRRSGTVAGFRYSRAMRAAAVQWDESSLDQYLKSPQEFVPGNLMPFSGVPETAQRAAVIDYLKSLK